MQVFWFPGSKTSKFLFHFFNFTIYCTLVYQCCEWCYVTSQVFQYSCSDEIESTCLFWIITLCSNLLPSPSSMWMLRHWWITVLLMVLVLSQGMCFLWSKLSCTACLRCLLCLLGCGAFSHSYGATLLLVFQSA